MQDLRMPNVDEYSDGRMVVPRNACLWELAD